MNSTSRAPNIIYFHSHDTGRYIAPYGYKVPTPRLQKFAEEGVLFRQAFCAAPTCSPSRAALFTGCAPHSVGMLGLAHKGYALDDYNRTLVSLLNAAGYVTVLCGGQHITGAPKTSVSDIGFTKVLATERIPTAADAARHAIDFLNKTNDDTPFFLDVGAYETHRYPAPQSFGFHPESPRGDGRYLRPPEPIPDTAETRSDWADYCESASRLDAAIGEVLDVLEARGLAEQTLCIFTTDHGPALPGMKNNLRDYGIQVALLLRQPGRYSAGQVCDDLVSQIDLLPTLCDLCGLTIPDWVQGTSLQPLLVEKAPIREVIFAEMNNHGVDSPRRCVRSRRFKLIRSYSSQIPNCDHSAVRTLFETAGWEGGGNEAALQLYDLLLDPGENRNLAGDPAYASVVQDLSHRLNEWMIKTNDLC